MFTQQRNTLERRQRRSDQRSTLVPAPHLIGVGVDGEPAGRDAVVLAAALARATQAEMMLIAAYEEPLLEGVVPAELGWTSAAQQARAMLARTRESNAALSLAASIALAAEADLHVRGVVVDRLAGPIRPEHRMHGRDTIVAGQLGSLSERARAAIRDTGARARVDVTRGDPVESLRELCDHVDLLVIGSGRAGASGQVQLGRASRKLLGDAPAPILITPRPRHAAAV